MSPQTAMGTETPVRHRILSGRGDGGGGGGDGPRKLQHSSRTVGGSGAEDVLTCFVLGF